MTHCWGDLAKGTDHDLVPVLPVGPFPVTVAIAVESEPDHRGHETDRINGTPWLQCLDCSTEDEVVDYFVYDEGAATSAIVAVGTLTEDGHHSAACVTPAQIGQNWASRCPGHSYGTYLYRLSDVVRLDTPIPAERTWECGTCGPVCADAPTCNGEVLPAWQVADDDLAAQVCDARKVEA